MEAPVCLIENSPDGKLFVNPQAKEILSNITQPVVVVAIVGLYRTGKSYLMNKLAGKNAGFDLGATVESKTKGIWMWCVPHPTKKKHTLVLLDTEGLGDVQKGDKKNDIWIFCLTVLLSSAMVYNSKGTIDQDAIEKLHYVQEITEKIKINASQNDDEAAEFSKHFPIFIWTVRDFTLSLEVNGDPITDDEYLEHALKLKEPEKTPKDQIFNFPKKCLRMYFPRRKCFVLCSPTSDLSLFQKLEQVSDDQLAPSFVAKTQKFCDYIFSYADVKHLDGFRPANGNMLGDLAQKYTEAISNGHAPCMENAVLSLSENENNAAVEKALEHYETEMVKKVVFPTETMNQFMDLSKECEQQAVDIFMTRSFRDKDHRFQKELMGSIQKKKNELLKKNEEASVAYCDDLLSKLTNDLDKAITDGSYIVPGGYQKFKEEMDKIVGQYNENATKGIKGDEVLQRFLKSKEGTGNTILISDKALDEKEKLKEAEKAKAESLMMERKVSNVKASQDEQKDDGQMNSFQINIQRLVEKLEDEKRMMRDQIERLVSEKRREEELLIRQGSAQQAKLYAAQIQDLEKEKEQVNETTWYKPIWENLKSVTVDLAPRLFNFGADMVKKAIAKYQNK
nr:MGC82824 protein [Xenopus laevis]